MKANTNSKARAQDEKKATTKPIKENNSDHHSKKTPEYSETDLEAIRFVRQIFSGLSLGFGLLFWVAAVFYNYIFWAEQILSATSMTLSDISHAIAIGGMGVAAICFGSLMIKAHKIIKKIENPEILKEFWTVWLAVAAFIVSLVELFQKLGG